MYEAACAGLESILTTDSDWLSGNLNAAQNLDDGLLRLKLWYQDLGNPTPKELIKKLDGVGAQVASNFHELNVVIHALRQPLHACQHGKLRGFVYSSHSPQSPLDSALILSTETFDPLVLKSMWLSAAAADIQRRITGLGRFLDTSTSVSTEIKCSTLEIVEEERARGAVSMANKYTGPAGSSKGNSGLIHPNTAADLEVPHYPYEITDPDTMAEVAFLSQNFLSSEDADSKSPWARKMILSLGKIARFNVLPVW